MPVTGARYDPAVMDQMPGPGRSGPPTAWLTRVRTSGECHRGSFGRWPAAPADSADDDHPIKNLLKNLGKKTDAVEREALTAMRSAPFGRAGARTDRDQGCCCYGYGDDSSDERSKKLRHDSGLSLKRGLSQPCHYEFQLVCFWQMSEGNAYTRFHLRAHRLSHYLADRAA